MGETFSHSLPTRKYQILALYKLEIHSIPIKIVYGPWVELDQMSGQDEQFLGDLIPSTWKSNKRILNVFIEESFKVTLTSSPLIYSPYLSLAPVQLKLTFSKHLLYIYISSWEDYTSIGFISCFKLCFVIIIL